jgi:hypothetical protein
MKTPQHRETVKQSLRRNGVSDGTQGIHEAPPLAACVKTLPEAVQTSLSERFLAPGADPVFVFARTVKAFEITVNKRQSEADLDGAFALWWNSGQSKLPPDSDFDTSRLLFLDAFSKVRAPLGSNPLAEAIRRAEAGPPPPEADRYPTSPKLHRLIAVCFHLQILSGDNPFFIGARDAARIAGSKTPHKGLALLNGLIHDGILTLDTKGTPGGRRASRYRYAALLAEANP